jgi:hypothetical protein
MDLRGVTTVIVVSASTFSLPAYACLTTDECDAMHEVTEKPRSSTPIEDWKPFSLSPTLILAIKRTNLMLSSQAISPRSTPSGESDASKTSSDYDDISYDDISDLTGWKEVEESSDE